MVLQGAKTRRLSQKLQDTVTKVCSPSALTYRNCSTHIGQRDVGRNILTGCVLKASLIRARPGPTSDTTHPASQAAAATTMATTTKAPDTTVIAVAVSTTAATVTTTNQAKPFFCDPNNRTHPDNTSPDCSCPKELGCKGGACKSKGSAYTWATVCAYCRDGYIKVAKKCVTQVACKGGKIVTPPKMGGQGCKCLTPGAHYCKRTARQSQILTSRPFFSKWRKIWI